MKHVYMLLVLLATGLATGCGGGQEIKAEPAHLAAGMKVMQKGIDDYQRGCYHRALDYFFKAHERFTASDQLNGVAMSLNNIGNVYRFIGDPESALLFFDEAVALYLAQENEAGALQALCNKAALLIDLGRFESAEKALARAETLEGGDKETASLLNDKGVLLIKQNAFDQAEKVLHRGLDLVPRSDLPGYATLNFSMGRLMLATDRLDRARSYFETALEADRQQGFHKGIADDLAALGSVYMIQDRYTIAAAHFQRSVKIYALIGNMARVEAVLQNLEDAAAKADLDIRITRLFVERWRAGKILESPCR